MNRKLGPTVSCFHPVVAKRVSRRPDRLQRRRLALESLEQRQLLSVQPCLELSGMQLVDGATTSLDQLIYVDMDGQEAVQYDGPVSVAGVTIPAFSTAGSSLAGQEAAIAASVLDQLNQTYRDSGVVFTAEEPAPGTPHSTIYVGGDGHEFSQYGSFVGLAEKVDVGNHDRNDEAFVFSGLFSAGYSDAASLTAALSRHISHEAGHLLGYAHSAQDARGGVLSDVANGTVTVEIVSAPTSVRTGQTSNVEVRIKFEGNTATGPWQVEELSLYDQDSLLDDQIVAVANPLQIASLGTWYSYTFTGVDLSAFDDDADGIELYAWGEVDDNTTNGFSPDDSSPVQQVQVVRDWTVMVYLDADCTLEGAGLGDFAEMASVGSTSDVSIVVQFDRSPGQVTTAPDWSDTRRGLVRRGDDAADWGTSIGEANMGSPVSAATFIDWAQTNYPADHYAFVFWDHGGGVNDGVCVDDSSAGDAIQTAEFAAALAGGSPFDLIGFDACLMGTAEVAYQVQGYGDVMVGSEELEPGDGWEYDAFLADLTADPAMSAATLGTQIVDSYAARYGSAQTLSAIDLSDVVDLASTLDDFAELMLTTATSDDWTGVLRAHDATRMFGQGAKDHYQLYDVGEWMTRIQAEQVSGDVKAAAAAVKTALDNSVLRRFPTGSTTAYGLSIYAPFAQLNARYDPKFQGNLIGFVDDTRWEEFVGPLGIDVVTVIDHSGSMDEPGKMEAAKAAAQQFIDVMVPRDKIGVVSYSTTATTDFPLTEMDSAGTVKSQAKAAVAALYPTNMTSIGSGVAAADGQLDRFQNDRVRAMLVMSDGWQNTDPEPIGVINNQVDSDIAIYTIGFGSDADAALLGQMASLRNGRYYFGGSVDLARIYFTLVGRISGRQQAPAAARTIEAGEDVEHEVLIDRFTDRATFAIDWQGSDIDLTLIAPDGSVIDPATVAGNPYISYTSEATYEMYTIELPMAGTWHMIAHGVSVPAGGETVNLYADMQSPVGLAVDTDRVNYSVGQRAHVEATLTDIYAVTGATVTATISGPSGSALEGTQFTLYDDGAHGDGAADDGVYANDSPALDLLGSYTFSVQAEGTSYWGDPFARSDFLSIAVTDAPQFQITQLDGLPASINEGDAVTLTGTFESSGTQSPQVSIDWGDGQSEVFTLAAGDRTFSFTHQYLDDRPAAEPDAYSVQITVSDDAGSDTAGGLVAVLNVAPVVDPIDAPDLVVPYQPFTCSAGFADPGTLDIHSATINWGDGSPTETAAVTETDGSGAATAQHIYTRLGNFKVTIVMTDDDGGQIAVEKTIQVRRAAIAPDPMNPNVQALFVGGGAGSDAIAVLQSRALVAVSIPNLLYAQRFTSLFDGPVYVFAGPGNDVINLATVSSNAVVFAGAGSDRIFAGRGDDDVDGGDGNDVIFGMAGNDLLRGSNGADTLFGGVGNDILLGGDGNDYLHGDGGQDLLVGGGGSDWLLGDAGQDLLIGGRTVYDPPTQANNLALLAIMQEWSRVTKPIGQRINSLRTGGGLNGSATLQIGTTVLDDNRAYDMLLGGLESDWFLTLTGDLTLDRGWTDR